MKRPSGRLGCVRVGTLVRIKREQVERYLAEKHQGGQGVKKHVISDAERKRKAGERNLARHVRAALAGISTYAVRKPHGKKARLAGRWAGKDRFWRSKATARDGSWNSPDYKGAGNGIHS